MNKRWRLMQLIARSMNKEITMSSLNQSDQNTLESLIKEGKVIVSRTGSWSNSVYYKLIDSEQKKWK